MDNSSKYIVLDRDGVINVDLFDYVRDPKEFEFEHKSVQAIKKLSDKNIPYNIFVKFYQFRHLVGIDVDNETIKDELSFFYHYLKDDKSKFIIDDISLGNVN